jgi:addiction module HigA family antidote
MDKQTNYAVAPGEYLAEWLDENQMTQQQAAGRLGVSRKQVNEIVNGRAPIVPEASVRLARLTGIPADSWLRFEATYRADLARLRDESQLAQHVDKIPSSVTTYLRAKRAITATKKAPGKLVSEFLTFHGFGTWEAFADSVDAASVGEFALAALKEQKSTFDHVACATWLRAGELSEAFEQGRHFRYDEDGLRRLLPDLRARASHPDESMLHDFATMLADVGVVFLMIEPPKQLPLYGVTRWIDKVVPVIQQSGRRTTDGYIIWTFFHELGHVLNDPRGSRHVEYSTSNKRNSTAETSANKFAYETLFGPNGISPWGDETRPWEIARIAQEVGVSPGVAVHQLRRRQKLQYWQCSTLLVTLGDGSDWSGPRDSILP